MTHGKTYLNQWLALLKLSDFSQQLLLEILYINGCTLYQLVRIPAATNAVGMHFSSNKPPNNGDTTNINRDITNMNPGRSTNMNLGL